MSSHGFFCFGRPPDPTRLASPCAKATHRRPPPPSEVQRTLAGSAYNSDFCLAYGNVINLLKQNFTPFKENRQVLLKVIFILHLKREKNTAVLGVASVFPSS